MSSHQEKRDSWEQMGAASGLFVTLLFAAAFIIFLMTDPGGGNTPALPDLTNTGAAPAFIADNLQAVRAQVMLNSIGLAFFLWFLGTLWSVLRRAEGAPGRGSIIALTGALAGTMLDAGGPRARRHRHADDEPEPGRGRSHPLHRSCALLRVRCGALHDLLPRRCRGQLPVWGVASLARLSGTSCCPRVRLRIRDTVRHQWSLQRRHRRDRVLRPLRRLRACGSSSPAPR